jgi:KRAB domain-containing zinc finger protein
MSLGFVDFREAGETFGGLSGMLRQILSPSPEIGEAGMSVNCNLLQGNSIFSNQSSMLSSTLLPPHFQSVCPDQGLLDQMQILTESYPCPTCGLEFRSALKLNYHMRTSHAARPEYEHSIENQPRYSCAVCSRSFVALSHLRMHEVTHTASPVAACASPTTSVANLASSGSMEKTFACDLCQASFRYRTLLERHRRMHQEIGQEKPYSCSRCLMRFETRNLYNHHAKTHRPPMPVNSDSSGRIIGAGTVSPIDPASTSTIAGPVIPAKSITYPCDSCSKQFTTAESLSTHKAVHRSRPLVCDVCGKGFTHRKYYVVHQRIHTGERPYLCAMCGKSFTQASTLTVHRRYHTGERPYTCTLCGKGFVTRTIMLNHMKKH